MKANGTEPARTFSMYALLLAAMAALLLTRCTTEATTMTRDDIAAEASRSTADFVEERARLVETLRHQGVRSERVLRAMARVPRHRFVPPEIVPHAYRNEPMPIGYEQTISQPYVVAYMTELLELEPDDRVLEVGTGSGYQAAVLAELAKEVYSVEIVPELAISGERNLRAAGYEHVTVRVGDGYAGWPEKAPFDAIIVTAAPDHIPPGLIEQLATGGRLVIPVGDFHQEIILVTKSEGGVVQRTTIPVRFVPMTGEAQRRNKQ